MKLCKNCKSFDEKTDKCRHDFVHPVTGSDLCSMDATRARGLWCGMGAKYHEKKIIHPCDWCGEESSNGDPVSTYRSAFGFNIICYKCSSRPTKEADLLAQGFYMGKGKK